MLSLVLALALTTPAPSPPPEVGVAKASVPAPTTPKLRLQVQQKKTGTVAWVTLHNDEKTPLVVVKPGDGSEAGWRTPTLTWSYVAVDAAAKKSAAAPAKQEGRCGMMNRVTVDEVFAIPGGGAQNFSDWVPDVKPPGPGVWQATLTWTNDPQHGGKGGSDVDGDDDAKAAVAGSDAFVVVSHPITFTWR